MAIAFLTRGIVAALLWSCLAGPVSAQAPTAALAPVPVEAFFGHASIRSASLSPSGRYLALISSHGGARDALLVIDVKDFSQSIQAARFADGDIDSFRWVDDERLVFSVIDLQAGSAHQAFYPALFAVNRDGTQRRQLVKLDRFQRSPTGQTARPPLEPNHALMAVPVGGADHVVVGEWVGNPFGEPDAVRPMRLNVRTGEVKSFEAPAPDHVKGWLFDPRGEPRLAVSVHEGRTRYHWRNPGESEYRVIADFQTMSQPYAPATIGADGTLYVLSDQGPERTSVLREFDFASLAPKPKPLLVTPGFDFQGAPVRAEDGRVLGWRVDVDVETTAWLDPTMAALQAEADQRMPGRVNRIACRRCGKPDMVAQVFSFADRDPGRYWLYEAETHHWRDVGRVRTGIDPRRMSGISLERIRARDGREIPVWITPPSVQTAAGKPPMVVLVHGGPWLRGREGNWDAKVQFLASRGYLVLEPEFRGSAGYGAVHLRSGFRQWGRAMQDDVADATRWATATGLADASRVCIAGASYGGYAALMGVIRDPDLYRCAIASAAVTDPRLLFEWSWRSAITEEARQYSLPTLIGDLKADAQMLAEVAPVELADKIKVPVLLAFGGKDRLVPIKHGTRMRDALIAAGQKPEWVVYEDEGHSLLRSDNRIDFARRMESFLAMHLKSN